MRVITAQGCWVFIEFFFFFYGYKRVFCASLQRKTPTNELLTQKQWLVGLRYFIISLPGPHCFGSAAGGPEST